LEYDLPTEPPLLLRLGFSGFMGFTYQHLYNLWDHVGLWPPIWIFKWQNVYRIWIGSCLLVSFFLFSPNFTSFCLLIVGAEGCCCTLSQSLTHTHSVGLLWIRYWPITDNTTLTRDRHPCPSWDELEVVS
jgi:hypothetical protein